MSTDKRQGDAAASSLPEAPAVFTTTHWSVVLAASGKDGPASTAALEALCRAYWQPLYSFVRRAGRSPDDAEDLIQGFFARLLEKDSLICAAREKGKFRSFLLVALKRYMANEWDRQHAQKRGGFRVFVEIDANLAESRMMAAGSACQPDILYEREWAMALLQQTLATLQEEYASSGRSMLFEQLQMYLTHDPAALPYAQIAEHLHLSEAAVKMAVHRLRARYREVLQSKIAQTVSSPEEVQDEIRSLFAAFS